MKSVVLKFQGLKRSHILDPSALCVTDLDNTDPLNLPTRPRALVDGELLHRIVYLLQLAARYLRRNGVVVNVMSSFLGIDRSFLCLLVLHLACKLYDSHTSITYSRSLSICEIEEQCTSSHLMLPCTISQAKKPSLLPPRNFSGWVDDVMKEAKKELVG